MNEDRIRELKQKIDRACMRCPNSEWLIGRFQCTVGRRRCQNRRVRRWLDEIKKLKGGKSEDN
jgi:hypothetical protein